MEAEKKRGCGPPPKYGVKSVVKSVRVPGDLWESLGTVAEREGTTRNQIIVETMQRKVKRELR